MMENLNVLFLAKFANCDSIDCITNSFEINYAQYHIEFRETLKKIFKNVYSTDNINDLFNLHNDFNYVISLYNRFPIKNSEIFVSSLCEYYKLPYLGATPNIRALAEDKHIAKSMASALNIPTSPWIIISNYNQLKKLSPSFEGPYFVKPRFGASSKNIDENCICYSWQDALIIINQFLSRNIDVIVEKFIDGLFYSVPAFICDNIINLSLPYTLLTNKMGNIVTHANKRGVDKNMVRNFCDKNAISNKLLFYSKKIYKNALPLDYARFDYIVESKTNNIYFLEFNVCCNLASRSGYVQTCLHNKLAEDYDTLIRKIIKSSLERQNLLKGK